MTDILCLLRGDKGDSLFYRNLFIERANERHSGNWTELKYVLWKAMLEGHEFNYGYYGDRLKGRSRLCPVNPILRWNDD